MRWGIKIAANDKKMKINWTNWEREKKKDARELKTYKKYICRVQIEEKKGLRPTMNSHEQQIEKSFLSRCDEVHWRRYFTEKKLSDNYSL